jgi:hypothetical protein
VADCISDGVVLRAKRHYLGFAVAAAALSVAGFSSCNSSSRSNEQQAAAAENEVYEAVVHDMTKSVKGHQLVFDDTLLTELEPGADSKSCEESARKNLRLEKNTPPYNSFADKLYRSINHGYDYSLRADTIQDFLRKSCMTTGPLSQTFNTDLPKTFIPVGHVHFNDLIANDGSKSFEQLFPGAGGIISFSRVGFDSTLHEAIVSTSFVCGMLCGAGQRYVLRKVSGRWQIVSGWTVWIS